MVAEKVEGESDGVCEQSSRGGGEKCLSELSEVSLEVAERSDGWSRDR